MSFRIICSSRENFLPQKSNQYTCNNPPVQSYSLCGPQNYEVKLDYPELTREELYGYDDPTGSSTNSTGSSTGW